MPLTNYEKNSLELLKMWRSNIKEGGVPRYTADIVPGAGLNVLVTWTDRAIASMEAANNAPDL